MLSGFALALIEGSVSHHSDSDAGTMAQSLDKHHAQLELHPLPALKELLLCLLCIQLWEFTFLLYVYYAG